MTYEIELNKQTGLFDIYFWASDGWHERFAINFPSELEAMIWLHAND